jgi:hypothetical protein
MSGGAPARMAALGLALACALPGAAAAGATDGPAGADALRGCATVLRALALMDAQPRLHLRLEVVSGRHPDGLKRLELRRADGLERLLLDGRALRTVAVTESVADALMLAPEGPCEADPPGATGPAALRYDAFAERGQSRVALWVDPASGLPSRARRDGPELTWGRSLSRPTKPPQPMLRPTGGRSVETIVFRYGADAGSMP